MANVPARKLATASEIRAELQRRIRASLELGAESRELVTAPMPVRLARRDHSGCNWTVPPYSGAAYLEAFMAELVRTAQAEFNLHD